MTRIEKTAQPYRGHIWINKIPFQTHHQIEGKRLTSGT